MREPLMRNREASRVEYVRLSKIRLNGNLRGVDHDRVRDLSESIAKIGLVHPLTLSRDYYLLAGRHRLEAARLLKLKRVECRITPYEHESPEARLLQLDENLMRRELTVLEQGEYLVTRNNILQLLGERARAGDNRFTRSGESNSPLKTTSQLASELGLSERVAEIRMQIAKALTPKQRDLIRDTPLANRTNELLQIARIKAVRCRTAVIRKMISKTPPKTVKVAVRQYRIDRGEISGEMDIVKPSNWWVFGNPKYSQEDGFVGSIPGEVYANALYYFAPQKGIAADGMAGSGMLKRVYEDRAHWQKDSHFKLKIHLYDQYPRKPFAKKYGIRKHDMTKPLPVKADWLFLDPPYFGIASGLYEGKLAQTKEYTTYLAEMKKVLESAFASLKPSGTLCLLTTEFVDISKAGRKTLDVPADLHSISINLGFRPIFRAYVSRGEQQRSWAGKANLKAKRLRRMFSDVCELLVFRKENQK